MKEVFPEAIRKLPEADIPIQGLTAYLSQDKNHQIVFMHFNQDVEVPAHSHGAQWGIVLEGQITLTIVDNEQKYTKGDRFYILEGETHSAKIHAGYSSMEFFADNDRYKAKE
ncbi:MAG: cupin domain-containing protein [Candidatus Heimdallarchaeota archaeon]|nr:cupin domain-containing protein [Candidatus Heimdallarchaeota archaeon]MCK5144240.1 cupin domain-containing protein [Candidatus Heimdallarchaeota archaeon]